MRPNRIDIITSIAGVSFEEAWASRVESAIEGLPVRFIGAKALLRNKESTGRPEDIADAYNLRKRAPKK